MENFVISGGRKLTGSVVVPAAKNAVLPLLAATVITKEDVLIENCPALSDVKKMLNILRSLGCEAEFIGNDIHISCKNAEPRPISEKMTGEIRSSVFMLGPMLSRFGYAKLSHPGGCEIGLRPIDLHIEGLRRLNVKIIEDDGKIICDGSDMRAGEVYLDFPSVGATENIIMASVKLDGTTIIRNAAREPEIKDLASFINALGGKVQGAGTDTVRIDGIKKFGGCAFRPIPDRIVAGTYMAAAAATGGEVEILGCNYYALSAVVDKIVRSGASVRQTDGGIFVSAPQMLRGVGRIETQPYPGFPTDMQPQIAAMLVRSCGVSVIIENVFENRFRYTMQLVKAGADITVRDRVAIIKGKRRLKGCEMTAQDLRGGAALVIAALAAEGDSVVRDVKHIDRGYYAFEKNLALLGAKIERLDSESDNM